MNGKRMAGAIGGGLVAGLGITALLMAGDKHPRGWQAAQG